MEREYKVEAIKKDLSVRVNPASAERRLLSNEPAVLGRVEVGQVGQRLLGSQRHEYDYAGEEDDEGTTARPRPCHRHRACCCCCLPNDRDTAR